MKRVFILMLCIIFVSPLIKAQEKQTAVKDYKDFEKNLIAGAKSDNLGLKVSSTYYLGELESQKAVIPLMSILKSDKDPEARIMAALALFKIGDEKGMFAVQQTVKFDDNEHVRRMCEIFYSMYLREQNLEGQ